MRTFTIVTTLLFLSLSRFSAANIYNVGPDQPLQQIAAVPWDRLQAGDEVRIHWRAEPYREKWVICARGTKEEPIVVRGIANQAGMLPVIDGQDATVSAEFSYWGGERSVIKVGGANFAEDRMPAWIVIDSLDIRNARPPHSYADSDGQRQYADHAAGIHIEKGENITVRNCIIHNNANGFFVSRQSSHITLEHCWIYDNGLEGSIYQHNVYTEAQHIIFQFNRFDRLRDGAGGNNIKDRSAGAVIRYNWIVGGNRLLDLVESDYAFIRENPAYRETFVYGNVMLKPAAAENSQIVHYGGDQGNEDNFRKGTLWFYHNTVVCERYGMTSVFRLSSKYETVRCINNIFATTTLTGRVAMLHELGTLYMHHNWLPYDWARFYRASRDQQVTHRDLVLGVEPGFEKVAEAGYKLRHKSPCRNAGTILPDLLQSRHPVEYEYSKHRQKVPRQQRDAPDLGAFER